MSSLEATFDLLAVFLIALNYFQSTQNSFLHLLFYFRMPLNALSMLESKVQIDGRSTTPCYTTTKFTYMRVLNSHLIEHDDSPVTTYSSIHRKPGRQIHMLRI